MSVAGGEHLTVLRRLAAQKALSTKRDYFSIRQTCTPAQVAVFKDHKASFETLIKEACTVKKAHLSVYAESATLRIRKKHKVDLFCITVEVHVRREPQI